MKNKINLFIVFIILHYSVQSVYSQEQIIIQTPNGTDVIAWINLPPLTPKEMQMWYNYMELNYPNAEIIAPPCAQYACHGYAWHTSATGQEVIITDEGARIYFSEEDMSYLEVDEPWFENYWNHVKKIYYSAFGNEHSAVYHSGSYYEPVYYSKWNDGPLVKHEENYCPYFEDFSSIKYYESNYTASIKKKYLFFDEISGLENFPNPFNPNTTISYGLRGKIVSPHIDIYNLKGQKIKTLALEEKEGKNSIIWTGTDENDSEVGTGIYFYRLTNNGKSGKIRKMMLLK